MSAARTVLVTGASGFIGGRLAALARERGHAVRTLTRAEWSGEPAVPLEDRFFGTLPWRIPPACLEGADAVVHCAALTGAGTDARAHEVNVVGTRRLAERAAAAGVARFVFVSSQSARADAPAAYGRTKHEAELALAEIPGLEVVIVRPGLVCGPGSRGLFARMGRLVEKLPVVPLLGGGRALVQPIHVDDLCAALLRALEIPLAPRHDGSPPLIASLGDPEGLPLAQFLRAVSRARLGREKPSVSVPLFPFEWAAAAAESLRIPLPIKTANLKGLRAVERMDTRASMELLGVPRRSIADVVSNAAPAPAAELPLSRRPLGVVLVGAGRIGLLHAVTASRQRGLALAAVVDPSARARGLLAGMGVRSRFTPALDEALALPGVDAAIVATPAGSHLELARTLLAKRKHLLVEKPLAVHPRDLPAFEALGAQAGDRAILVGYLAPRYPQAAAAVARLRAGDFGRVLRYEGFTLLSFISERDSRRWEVQPEVSGGGVLANAAGHTLSLVRAAFGDPRELRAGTWSLHSERVEDSARLELVHEGFAGTCHASWSIEGVPRQENRLVVTTERGRLTLTNNVAVFEPRDGGVAEVAHQLDFDVGFNLMADYAGGGISAEHRDLQAAVRDGVPPPMGLDQALGVERLLHRAYEAAQDGPAPSVPPAEPLHPAARTAAPEAAAPDRARLLLDLREVDDADLAAFARRDEVHAWAGLLVTPLQVGGLAARGLRLHVTVPDFMRQARLLSAGRPFQLLAEWGPIGLLAAVRGAAAGTLRERGATFWAVVQALLGEALRHVPRDFDGTLLLHSMPTDLALALSREDALTALVAACRSTRPRAQVGVHATLADHVVEVASHLDVAALLSSPRARGLDASVASLLEAKPRLRVLAEAGPAPAACHRAAAASPAAWEHGAHGVVVGAAAEPLLAAALRSSLDRRFAAAFQGAAAPEGLD